MAYCFSRALALDLDLEFFGCKYRYHLVIVGNNWIGYVWVWMHLCSWLRFQENAHTSSNDTDTGTGTRIRVFRTWFQTTNAFHYLIFLNSRLYYPRLGAAAAVKNQDPLFTFTINNLHAKCCDMVKNPLTIPCYPRPERPRSKYPSCSAMPRHAMPWFMTSHCVACVKYIKYTSLPYNGRWEWFEMLLM
jgi:hypothetical protein